MTASASENTAPDRANPLLGAWSGPARDAAFRGDPPGAFPRRPSSPRIAENMAEIEAIAGKPTAAELRQHDRGAGAQRPRARRGLRVFYSLAGAHTNDAHPGDRARDVAAASPRTATASSSIAASLPAIKALWDAAATLGLYAEQARVLERYEVDVPPRRRRPRAAPPRPRVAAIAERLATLGTAFGQNVLADEQSYALVLETEDDLAGLPARCRDAAARRRRSAACPANTRSRCRARASSRSCSPRPGATCARRPSAPGSPAATAAARPTTRRSSPRRCGCAPSARGCSAIRPSPHYRLDDAMAKTPEAVRGPAASGCGRRRGPAPWPTAMRCRRWPKPRAAISPSPHGTGATTPRSCARRGSTSMRARSSRISRSTSMIAAAFDTAGGCSACPSTSATTCRSGIPMCGSGRSRGAGRRPVGLFFGDYFARSSKRSGAWMTTLRVQEKLARRHPAARRQRDELRQGGRPASRRCCRSTMPARCSTSSATGCTACCRT